MTPTRRPEWARAGDLVTADGTMIGRVERVVRTGSLPYAAVAWSSGSTAPHSITTLKRVTTTEANILRLAAAREGRYSIEWGGGRGPEGGKVKYGDRDRIAVAKLVDKGLVEITHKSSHADCNRGYTVWSYIWAFRVK